MNKTKIFSLLAAGCIFAFACNDNANKTASEDTAAGTTAGTETTTSTSTTDYAAKADEFQKNSEAGKYRDVKTGKPIKISVDRTTGSRTNMETNQPVRRYVLADSDTDWWLYDESDTRLGKVRWENNKMWYEDNGNWVEYDDKWKDEETGDKVKVDEGDGDIKSKSDDTKVKIDKDGDSKIKTKDAVIKTDKDGKTKVKDN